MSQILYTNDAGSSFLPDWTNDELQRGYFIAERENDDVFYLAIMSEFERRKLRVIDGEVKPRQGSAGPASGKGTT